MTPRQIFFLPLCPKLLWIIRKRAVCHCLSPNQCWQAEILVLPPRGVWWAEVGQICTWSSFGLTVFGFHCMSVNEQRRVKPWILSSNKADQKIFTLALFLLFFLMTSLLLLNGELARRVVSLKEKKKTLRFYLAGTAEDQRRFCENWFDRLMRTTITGATVFFPAQEDLEALPQLWITARLLV